MPRGEILTFEQANKLAVAWYHDRAQLDWRRKTPAEARIIFNDIGLTSDFWQT